MFAVRRNNHTTLSVSNCVEGRLSGAGLGRICDKRVGATVLKTDGGLDD